MNEDAQFIPTRQSLLSRLKDWNDQESWRDFFETYWKLIYTTALKAGLTDAEAQDVVQETVLSVLKGMPDSQYDSAKGTFKNWLLRLTAWRVADQMRKRGDLPESQQLTPATVTDADRLEHIPDPDGFGLEAVWDEEWKRNLMEAAIERVKRKVDPKHYQAFDLYVLKNWPVSKVAHTLSINPGRVYLLKHRINSLIKREISALQTKPF